MPTICGSNTGQHSEAIISYILRLVILTLSKKKNCPVYVDMGTVCSDSVSISFAFTGASTVRTWELKASQIPCGSVYRLYTRLVLYFSAPPNNLIDSSRLIFLRQSSRRLPPVPHRAGRQVQHLQLYPGRHNQREPPGQPTVSGGGGYHGICPQILCHLFFFQVLHLHPSGRGLLLRAVLPVHRRDHEGDCNVAGRLHHQRGQRHRQHQRHAGRHLQHGLRGHRGLRRHLQPVRRGRADQEPVLRTQAQHGGQRLQRVCLRLLLPV